ncbi:MAG: hypothetical protein N2Z62_14385 [Rhodobacteraceae bacterium]|nr:hypothetical protein [Paracoccaceae bacterium]
MIRFHLSGPFRVVAPDGRDIAPAAAKAQGVLLLLLTGIGLARGRAWVQDMLWSDRGEQQAAGSLRQSLTQIRQAFGPHADILRADRRRLSLDPDRVEVIETGSADFAEGLDVRDREFETWLAAERARRPEPRPGAARAGPGPAAAAARTETLTVADAASGGVCGWTERVIADGLARTLSELFQSDVRRSPAAAAAEGRTLLVESVQPSGNSLALRIEFRDNPSQRQIWAGHCIAPLAGAPPVEDLRVLRLANQAVEAVGEAILAPPHRPVEALADDPDVLCRRAIRHLYRMRPEEVRRADALFAAAGERSGRGLFHAWRAQARTIQLLERHETDVAALREAGAEHLARALEAEPNNSMVLAMAANARLFLFREPGASLELARRAVGINPANPMAWWALSSARLYTGDPQQSYADALRGREIAILSPNRFWWDLQRFAGALLLGQTEEAIRVGRGITAQCPDFKPPWRYLIALHASAGDEALALEAAQALARIEPDFSIDRLLSDRDYPASLLHRAPGLDLDRVRSLA